MQKSIFSERQARRGGSSGQKGIRQRIAPCTQLDTMANVQQVEFTVPETRDLTRAAEKIEQVCAALGLTMSMKTSQAAFPGSTHWHYKNKKLKGTLELTLYIPARRVWANVQSGRKAPWIDAL